MNEDNSAVTVGVAVKTGDLSREVVVGFNTVDSTATSTCMYHLLIYTL